jgi:GT2 family glycosyltransferase
MTDLTIVIPTMGSRPNWLAENVESIRRQQVPIAIVAVTSDSTAAEVVRRVAPDIPVQVQEEPGLTAAINQGMRAARTKYVGWLGDDDVLVPNTAHLMLGLMQRRPDAPFGFGRLILFNADGTYHFTLRPTRFAPIAATTLLNFVPQQGTIFRKQALDQVGFADETLRFAMDLDLWLRLRKLGTPAYLPQVVGGFRWHTGGLTLGNQASRDEAQLVRLRHAGKAHRAVVTCSRPTLRLVDSVLYKLGLGRRDLSPAQIESLVGITPRQSAR